MYNLNKISLEVDIMNKIFEIIWSKARNAFVVVSELAKNHCRASKAVTAAVMVSVLAGTMAASPAWCKVTEYSSQKYTVVTGTIKTMKDDHDNSSATPTYTTADMAIGSNSVAKGDKSTAIGNNSNVDGDYSIAIGNTSMVVDGSSSVAIGNHSTATGAATTVIGAQASGVRGATVIGMNSKATGIDSVAIGLLSNVNNGGGVAIGRNAVNAIDPGDGGSKPGVSIGDTSKAYGQSIAIGAVAHALGSYSIAIGEGAEVKEKSEYSSVFGTSAKIAEKSKYSVVSGAYSNIGEDSQYSTLVGANSSIGSSSSLSTLIGGYAKIGTNSAASILMGLNGNIKDNAYGSTAIGYNTMVESKAYYSTVIGYESKATQNIWNGTALGRESKVSVDEGIALGSYSIASTAKGEVGYDALTGENSTDESITWKATSAAVPVGGRVSGYKDVTRQITNVAAGTQDTDAVNVAQLKRAMEKANFKFKAGNGIVIETVKGDDGTTYKISTNITGADTKTDTTTVTPSASGDGGTIGGDTGIIVSNPGITPSPNQPETDNNIQTGTPVMIETVTKPTKFTADDGNTLAISPSETLGIKGDSNITTKTDADGKNIQVTLNQDLDVNSVAANTFKAGDTTITDNGLTINNGPSVTKNGINAGGKKITNVAPGELSETSKDAVNGSQLHETNINVANNSMRISKLGDRVNKVGAGAAALAALHPMDFDPDDKWSFAAGYGNYAGENAAAIGAYYRPDEKVMFSVGGTVGNGENMVNAGISFALDRTNHVSNSRTALAREVIDLRGQLAEMGAKMAKMEKAFGMLDETKTKLFPDIQANHWAYEYIAKLAGNGYIEGYPDGNFGGDRLMTRYEFAAMLYRAIENGAALEEKIIKEFEPELGRIRVDRISGEDGDRDKIERVRVNDTKGERDHYGNKLAK